MEQESVSIPTPNAPNLEPHASTRALAALILGILSCIFFGLFAGIPAIVLGRKEEKAILRGEAPVAGNMMARLGWILGIVGISLWCLIGIILQVFFGSIVLLGIGGSPG